MPDQQRRPKRATCVSRCGLDKITLEGRLRHDAAIHYGVERDSTGHAKILFARALMQTFEQVECGVFQNLLGARGNVPMMLRQLLSLFPRQTKGFRDLVAKLVMLGEVMV